MADHILQLELGLDFTAAKSTRCFVISATGRSVHAKAGAVQRSRSRSRGRGRGRGRSYHKAREELLDSTRPRRRRTSSMPIFCLLCCVNDQAAKEEGDEVSLFILA